MRRVALSHEDGDTWVDLDEDGDVNGRGGDLAACRRPSDGEIRIDFIKSDGGSDAERIFGWFGLCTRRRGDDSGVVVVVELQRRARRAVGDQAARSVIVVRLLLCRRSRERHCFSHQCAPGVYDRMNE
jgi:hypothetical protein